MSVQEPVPVNPTSKEALGDPPEPTPTMTNGVDQTDPFAEETRAERAKREMLLESGEDEAEKAFRKPVKKRIQQKAPTPNAALQLDQLGGTASTTRIGVWDLDSESFADEMPPANAESIYSVNIGPENIIGTDDRKLVSRKDFSRGGKYRCQ